MPVAASLYHSLSMGGRAGELPLVLIHGAGGSLLSWPAGVRRLQGRRVLALDLPGHGKSGGTAQHTITQYAGAVSDFLEEINLPRVVLAGHSMGAAIALQVALDEPETIAALVVASSGATMLIPPALVEALSSPLTYQSGLHSLRQLVFSPFTRLQLQVQCMRPLADVRPSLLLADWRACAGFDLTARLPEIKMPIWVVCGAEDRLSPPSTSRALAAGLASTRLQIIPQAGHMLPAEQPAAFQAGLEEFLASLARTPDRAG